MGFQAPMSELTGHGGDPPPKMTGSEKLTLDIESGFRINMAGRLRIRTHSWLASKRNTTIDDMT